MSYVLCSADLRISWVPVPGWTGRQAGVSPPVHHVQRISAALRYRDRWAGARVPRSTVRAGRGRPDPPRV